MSASLVGSEMCIRDSRCSPSPTWQPRGRWAARPGAWWTTCCSSLRAGSVSYTHLTLPTICSV
eukprot:12443423-Alexandrium_andersonii.AAC.1